MLLEKVADKQIIIYIMAVVAVIGALAEVIARMITNRLLREARNIHHSTHPLMKLIKAKYEHANLVTERVQNVEAFVDKYLYEYQVVGMKYHSWQSMGFKSTWIVFFTGILGAAIMCLTREAKERIVDTLLYGAIGVAGLFMLRILLSEQRKLVATRTYIVDYLQNVCAHRHTRAETTSNEEVVVKEEQEEKVERPATEIKIREILEEFLA